MNNILMLSYLFMLPGAFFAPVIHEFVKARVSAALGDRTPAKNGFITFNPFKFFEPIGFFMMMYFQVGWGQPVTTSPFYYKDKRKGIILTYTLPILANLVLGLFVAATLRFLPASLPVQLIAMQFARANIGLALFNLIPIYPMAGNRLLHLFVSPETSMQLTQYEKPLQILLFLLLIFGVVGSVIFPMTSAIMRLVM